MLLASAAQSLQPPAGTTRAQKRHMSAPAAATVGRPRRSGVARPLPPPRRTSWRAAAAPATIPQLTPQLQELDALLAGEGPEAEAVAVALAEQLREEGTLRSFGAARSVPKRAYTLEELRLNKIEPTAFLSPQDTTLNGVRTILQLAYLAGLTAACLSGTWDIGQVAQALLATAFLLVADQVANAGGLEALAVDSAGRLLSGTYARRVALHEAGHFLVAYLLGLLPHSYTLTSWQAYTARRQLNIQAGTRFCDAAFQAEVAAGRLSASSLDTYACVALAGVATEWLRFGHAEGGLGDMAQLDALLAALKFTQAKADSEVRWAVLNVVMLLRRHGGVHDALADAMVAGASVGTCIAVIEAGLASAELI